MAWEWLKENGELAEIELEVTNNPGRFNAAYASENLETGEFRLYSKQKIQYKAMAKLPDPDQLADGDPEIVVDLMKALKSKS